MQSDNTLTLKSTLESAFKSGYVNAASALSKIIKERIFFENFHTGFYRIGSELAFHHEAFKRPSSAILITTEIIGSAQGKSYLLLTKDEYDILTSGILEGRDPAINLKEEFIKELDNILSASVITHLSNDFKRKLFGDVPLLISKSCGQIETLINDDFEEKAEEIYVNAAYFSFQDHPHVSPVFVWVIDCQNF